MKKYFFAFFSVLVIMCSILVTGVCAAELFPVSKNGKWGYIDSQGKTVIEFKYDAAGIYEFGVATARDKDGIYILGKGGEAILKPENDAFVQIDATGIYSVYSDITDYYDLSGTLIGAAILTEPYARLEGRFTKDYAAYWTYEKDRFEAFFGFIDKTGEIVLPAKYSDIATYESSENFVVRESGGNWKLVDTSGETIKEYPASYVVSGKFNIGELFALANEDGLYGYYSFKTGEPVLPHKYIRAEYFRDNRAIVAEPTGLGIINQQGEYIVTPIYNNIYPLGEGLFGANTYDGKRVILDNNGKMLLERKDGTLHFSNFKYGYTSYFEDGKMHLVGTDGKVKYSIPSLISGSIMSESIFESGGKYVNFVTGNTIYDQNQTVAENLTINWITVGKDYDKGWYPALYQYPVVSGYKDAKVNGKINSVLKKAFVDNGIMKFENYYTGSNSANIFGKIGYFGSKPLIGVYDLEMKQHSISVSINMQTGKTYKLTDLFLPGFEERLARLVRQSGERWENTEPEFNEGTEFGLYSEGIILPIHTPGMRVTDPGEYSDILIPYTDIEDILNKNGEMWYSLKYSDTANLLTQELNFTDLLIEHWATVFIQDANYNGIIFGDTRNGKPVFRPNDNLKYTEAVAMATRAMKLSAADRKLDSIDQNQWYSEEINKAYSAGLLEGAAFSETANISRKEMFMVLAHGIKSIEPDRNVILREFTDCGNLSDAELDAASICYKSGIIIGNENKLNPDGLITRAEIAKIIICFVKIAG